MYAVSRVRHAAKTAKSVKLTAEAGEADYSKKNSELMGDDIDSMKKACKGSNDYKGNMNCAYASFTYDMRRRGYDVTSIGTTEGVDDYNYVKHCYKTKDGSSVASHAKIVKQDKMTKYKSLVTALEENGGGKRGIFFVSWEGLGAVSGHAMAYEKVGGKYKIIDPQIGKVYNAAGATDMLSDVRGTAFGLMQDTDAREGRSLGMTFLRTDDMDIDIEACKQYTRARKGTKK